MIHSNPSPGMAPHGDKDKDDDVAEGKQFNGRDPLLGYSLTPSHWKKKVSSNTTTTGEGIREDCNFKRFSLIFIPPDVTLLLPLLLPLVRRRVSFLMPGRMYLLVHTATDIGIALSESACLTWSGYLNQVRMLRRAFSSPPPESHAENVYLGQSQGICLNLSEQTERARVCEYTGNPELCSLLLLLHPLDDVGGCGRQRIIHCKNIKYALLLLLPLTAQRNGFIVYNCTLAQHLKILLLPLLLVLRGRKSFVAITRHPTIAIFSTGPVWRYGTSSTLR